VETHELPLPDGTGKWGRTKLPAMDVARDFFDAFHQQGYALFSKEANGSWGRGVCYEWSFLKLHPDFFASSDS